MVGYADAFYKISVFQIKQDPILKINDEFNTISNLSAAIILKELLKNKSNKDKREKIAQYWKKKIIDKDIDIMSSERPIYNKFYRLLFHKLSRGELYHLLSDTVVL